MIHLGLNCNLPHSKQITHMAPRHIWLFWNHLHDSWWCPREQGPEAPSTPSLGRCSQAPNRLRAPKAQQEKNPWHPPTHSSRHTWYPSVEHARIVPRQSYRPHGAGVQLQIHISTTTTYPIHIRLKRLLCNIRSSTDFWDFKISKP